MSVYFSICPVNYWPKRVHIHFGTKKQVIFSFRIWPVLLWSHLLFHNGPNELLTESLRISIGTRRVNYKLVIEFYNYCLQISNKIPIVCLTNPHFFFFHITYYIYIQYIMFYVLYIKRIMCLMGFYFSSIVLICMNDVECFVFFCV